MSEQSEHVRLALAAVEAHVKEGRVIDVPPTASEELLGTRAGVFVCIKTNGQLRGCIGTIEPVQGCVAEEIIANAISAASKDPRFMPVDERELPTVEYSVDVLTAPEAINGISELDPKVYGVIVESGARRGLLLPDLDGVDTAEEQVDIARHKAVISPSDPIKLYRFRVIRHH